MWRALSHDRCRSSTSDRRFTRRAGTLSSLGTTRCRSCARPVPNMRGASFRAVLTRLRALSGAQSLGSFLCAFWHADADDPCSGRCICGDPSLKLPCGSFAGSEVIEFSRRDASRFPVCAGGPEHHDKDVFHANLPMWNPAKDSSSVGPGARGSESAGALYGIRESFRDGLSLIGACLRGSAPVRTTSVD